VCSALLVSGGAVQLRGRTAPDAAAEVALERQYNIQIHDDFAKQAAESVQSEKQVKANKELSAMQTSLLQISTAPDAAAEVALERQYNIQIHDDFAKQAAESVQSEKQVKANKELSAMQTSLLQVSTAPDAAAEVALEKQYNIQIHDVFAKQAAESVEVVKQVKANRELSALQLSVQSKQEPEEGSDLALYGSKQGEASVEGEEGSDVALYGGAAGAATETDGQETEDASSERDSDSALYGSAGQDESDKALYGSLIQEGPEDGSDELEAGSDAALFGGSDEGESDSALYGAQSFLQVQSKQEPEEGSDLALYASKQAEASVEGEEGSDVALYGGATVAATEIGGQETDDASSERDSDAALYGSAGQDESDKALYGSLIQEGPEDGSDELQAGSDAALFGGSDEDESDSALYGAQ